ncbi:MAG: L-lysine 6-transaminase [Candidatus Kapabacteria bacterium]|nr:L-lysine 6-transaminase [Candidatus Kapabacteria bacterium]
MNTSIIKTHSLVTADNVLTELRKHMLIDGFDFILDLDQSGNGYFHDAVTGKKFLDFFTCFASIPFSLNHPKLNNEDYIQYIGKVALHKPSNSDLYTSVMADFVKTFFDIAVPKHFKYSFYVEGGALANENALKVAFDWKVKRNFRKGYVHEKGLKVLHFKEAFHGRSGYTMSLTNTDPNKVALYPKFDWPRVTNPKLTFPLTEESLQNTIAQEKLAIAQIHTAIAENKDDIAAMIIEPIQGEGGDNHFRPEFLQQLRTICDENEILLIFDEVQTGVGITGSWWAHEQLGVTPDIMSFGKKMQVCGIVVSDRIDNEPENVFHKSSRINSTWGGNLVDMARATKYLQVLQADNLVHNAKVQGEYLKTKMMEVANRNESVSNVRGMGLYAAFDLPTPEKAGAFLHKAYDNGLLILRTGSHGIRFRPPLDITTEHIDEGVSIIEKTLLEI